VCSLNINTNEYVHTHNIRSKNDMHLPRVNTGHRLKCAKYKIPKLWNEHKYLKEQTWLDIFKNELKLYLITKLYNDNDSRLLRWSVNWDFDKLALCWFVACTAHLIASVLYCIYTLYVDNCRQPDLMICEFVSIVHISVLKIKCDDADAEGSDRSMI